MKKMVNLLVAVFVLSFLGIAGATSFTLENFKVSLHKSGPGLIVHSAKIQSTPYSFNLNVGESTTFDLFRIWTNEDRVNLDDQFVHNPINVSMKFTAPSPSFGGSIPGETFGDAYGSIMIQEWGMVLWTEARDHTDFGKEVPVTLNFGNNGTGELQVKLSNESFNLGSIGLWESEEAFEEWGGLKEGCQFGRNVQATITYARAVPESATLLLLGGGLVGLVGLKRKMK